MLRFGDRGPDVMELQDWLIEIGYLTQYESFFSSRTKRAIINLQKDLDLQQTGEYDEQLKIIYNIKASQPMVMSLGGKNASTQAQWDFSQKIGTDKSGVIQCYIQNLITGTSIVLPHIPDDYTQSKANNFEETMTKGRSSPFLGYEGSSARTLDFTVNIDANFCPNRDIDSLLTKILALAYPRYGNMIVPPKCAVRIGNTMLEGVLIDVNITRKLPIINGVYSQAEVSFNFTECEPYASSAVTIESRSGDWNGGV